MYYETGEEAYEDVTIYYPVRPYLYPTESDDPFYFEYEDAEKIANYPNYASVKAWVALRETFRARYPAIMEAVEEGHAKGTLGPGEDDWRAIAHYNRFWEEVREAYFNFCDDFDAEYEKRENTYFTFPSLTDGASLRDGDLKTKWDMMTTLEGHDYQDILIAGHRDIYVEGYALTVSNINENDLNFPRRWALYGAYLDAEEVTEDDFDVSQMTLLDEQTDFRFYYLDEMRVDFVVSHPGTYNRFVLRVFNHRDDLCYDNPITISELEFHEDEFEPTPVIDYGPEPDIAPFQVLENSVKGFDNAFLRIRCSELAADGPFYLLGKGKIEAIFRSVDPDRPEVIYDDTMSNPALEFDAEGNLTVPLVVKYGFGLFNVEYGLPKIPGYICDVIVRFRAVERATGRIVDVEKVVPYEYAFYGPSILGNDPELKSCSAPFAHDFKRTVTDLDFKTGFTIDIEVVDHDHPADSPLIYQFDYPSSDESIQDQYGRPIFTLSDNTEWEEDGRHMFRFGPSVRIDLPIAIGSDGATVTLTTTNKGNRGTTDVTFNLSYTPIENPDNEVRIYYTSGHDQPTDPRPLTQWVDSNVPEFEAFKEAFASGNAKRIDNAILRYSDSNYKTFTVRAPNEWGEAVLSVESWEVRSGDKFYVCMPRAAEERTYQFSIAWPKVGYSRNFSYTLHPFPENEYYLFAPVIDGADGEQSVTLHYTLAHEYGEPSQRESVTTVGLFGTGDPDPDYLCIHDPRGIDHEGFLALRDENTKRAVYVNKEHRTKTIIGSNGEPVTVVDADHILAISERDAYWHPHTITCSAQPVAQIETLNPHLRELHIDTHETVQLQIIDEDGHNIGNDIIVTSAFIRVPENSGAIPFGTTVDYNPFIKGEQLDVAVAEINGIVAIDLPTPEEGYMDYVVIEVADKTARHGVRRFGNRIISRLTTPEAFTDYFDQGLPYPCVLRSRSYYVGISDAWIRPAGTSVLSDERSSLLLAHGSELGYESGKSVIDIMAYTDDAHVYESPYTTNLADGTVSRDWEPVKRLAIFAPTYAVSDIKYNADNSFHAGKFYDQNFIDPLTIMRDDAGRQIIWPTSLTGFEQTYTLNTFTPDATIPRMTQQQTEPNSADVVLSVFSSTGVDDGGRPIDSDDGGDKHYWSTSIGRVYNTAVEEISPEGCVRSVAEMTSPSFDGDAVPEDDSTTKIDRGLRDFEFSSPSCLPFASLLVTSKEGEYRIRSSFEVNAMDFIMPQNQAMEKLDKIQKRVNDVATFTLQYMRVKNTCLGDYTTDIFEQDDGVFVGFKGFLEMAVIKDYKANAWKPYFTGFGAKLEASAQFSWQLQCTPLFAKMTTRGEVSTSFLLLNPHPKDYALNQAALNPQENLNLSTFNPYSHFNLYLLSTYDLSLCLQAGIGFDAGFIAAHGGLMGKARAATRFAYVNRPYLGSNYSEGSGARFDLSASLSAYAYFKFAFLKYSKEWPICSAAMTCYSPDNNWNPWKSDPNLNLTADESNARVRIRPLTMTYKPQRKRVSVIGSRTISDKVDIFANPIYMNGGDRLAFFHVGNPTDANDDRVFLSGTGCNVNNPVGLYADDVPAFTYHAASAGDHQIVAVQRLAQPLSADDNDMAAAAALTDKLQIVASVNDGDGTFTPTIISPTGSANTDPRAAIAQNGSAAVVWASGDIEVVEHESEEDGTYTEPCLTGDIVLAQYVTSPLGEGNWTTPIRLTATSPSGQVKDYALATGGERPIVIASTPSVDADGNVNAPTSLYTVNANGGVRRQSLGIQGAQHQIVAVYAPGETTTRHFVASSLVAVDDKGTTDIQLFDITLTPDGNIRHSSLGRLGLNRYRILSYRLVSPKHGATGVDGLGIIWNQHEQDNTDDETLDATPYNRTYVARINRRGDYIYLSHAAQALEFEDDMSVADMTAYMDFDTSLNCPVVTAAFCIGETQVDGASTAAEIIEKKISLNNEIEWLEEKSGLANIIDRKNGTEIKLTVRNIGLHTIRNFTVKMAGMTFDIPVNVAPSVAKTLTVKLPAKTDFSADVPFTILADFYDIDITDPGDEGTKTETVSVSGTFRVNVVDFVSGVTANRYDAATKRDVVVLSVSNLSPMALKPGNSVKVSLFTDALGDTQYPGVATYTIPASELYNATTGRGLVKTVSFYVPAPAARTTVYAICRTVDSDGNVVFDQNSTNNMAMVSLAPANFGSETSEEQTFTIGQLVRLIDALKKNADNPGKEHTTPDQDYNGDSVVTIDDVNALVALIAETTPDRLTVSDLENPQLKVTNVGKSITIEGLNPEKDLKVFDATGRLLKWTEPAAEEVTVEVNAKGTLIIVNDGKAGVIRH